MFLILVLIKPALSSLDSQYIERKSYRITHVKQIKSLHLSYGALRRRLIYDKSNFPLSNEKPLCVHEQRRTLYYLLRCRLIEGM